MISVLAALLMQLAFLTPRGALENPAVLQPVPKAIQKDFARLYQRFLTGREDARIRRDGDKLLAKKARGSPHVLILMAYLDLYERRRDSAVSRFETVLGTEPRHRIALYYLAELAFDNADYPRAATLYGRLFDADPARPGVDDKRTKALLLATEGLLRQALTMESAGNDAGAEETYRRILLLAPDDATLRGRLGSVLLKQKKYADALSEFRRQAELGGASEESDSGMAESLRGLGRTAEADSVGRAASRDGDIERQLEDLENLGRWGPRLDRFRDILAATAVTREQLSTALVRYFPQIQPGGLAPVLTDVESSWARDEIRMVVGSGLMDSFPNHTFQPAATIRRGELAVALSRLLRLLRGPIPAVLAEPRMADLPPTHPWYRDIQHVVGTGVMPVDPQGAFNNLKEVSGREAIDALERLLDLLRRGDR